MYVLIVRRLVKMNTGNTEKFSPRTVNRECLRVSGPFLSLKAVQRAVLAVLATHTALDAQVWSEAQLQESSAKALRWEEKDAILEGVRLIQAARVEIQG